MTFGITPELEELRKQVRAFVDERVIPREDIIIKEDRDGRRDALNELSGEARSRGLFVPHLPREWGGRGLGALGMCVTFREMGRSLVAARVCNCDAPDQGNMDLLIGHAGDAIKERWLGPLCRGETTSAFCMTEPAPGAGSDPQNLRTTAERDGDGFVLRGRKWFATGARDAAFLIVVARTSPDPKTGATLFVVDRHAPGITWVRDVPTMSEPLLAHREAELTFDDVRIGSDSVLGSVGEGFRLVQARLVPARLTHCMRWLGLADRALHLCRDYLRERTSSGRKLAEHQLVQRFVARGAEAIHAGNLMTLHCAHMLEAGRAKEARVYSSLAKTHVARALCQVLDDAIQVHGARGYSEDAPFGAWYRYARAARIADGPDEVHEAFVAREFFEERLVTLV
jgi:acyl-CoA dehydrogenase